MAAPETIFVGGNIFTAGWASSRAGAVAVANGRILAVGDEADVLNLAGTGTVTVDIADRLLLPAFHDAHAHPVAGGVELLQCDLTVAESADHCFAIIAEYSSTHPEEEWILGGGWSMAHFVGGTPTTSMLDAIVADRPVALVNRDHHGLWANSEALRRAGISAATPDPADGRIERDSSGNPTGMLHEGAMALLEPVKPGPDAALSYRGLLKAQEDYFRQGIVGWQDAYVDAYGGLGGIGDILDVYLAGVDRGDLKARVTAALWWERAPGLDQLPSLIERRQSVLDRGREDILNASTVKIMVDGVTENFTAAMSVPYLDSCGHPTENSGLTFIDPMDMARYVVALDAAGFTVHFHALGDRAVTLALDAVEAARRANGMSGNRHHLAHLQIVGEPDIPRFNLLGATANLQMLWATIDDQLRDLGFPHMDPKFVARHYPFGELVASGADLAAGSDWPVSTANPLQAIHVGVNRVRHGEETGALGYPEQAIALATALSAYTAGSARVNGREQYTGRLRVGMEADLAVLSQDPFASTSDTIGEAQVVSTWVSGNNVFTRP